MLRNLSVFFLAMLVSCGAQAQTTAATLVFAHVNVIDAPGAPAQSGMSVVVRGGRIVDIEKSSAARIPEHATVVEGRGKYLIPGLWDMHVHTAFGEWVPPDENTLRLFVAN